MESIISRYKHLRHNTHYRRKRRPVRSAYSTAEKVAKKIALSALILLLAVIIKSVDTPVTNYIEARINKMLTTDIDFKKAFDSVSNTVSNFFKKFEENTSDEPSDKSGETGNGPGKINDNTTKEAVLGSGYEEQGLPENENITGSIEEENNLLPTKTEKDFEAVINDIKRNYNFTAPLEGTLCSPHGERIDPFTREPEFHYGVDIDGGRGSLVKAALDGFVTEVRSNKEYGNYIKIDHGNGLYTIYAHCSDLMVSEGQQVRQGQVIAKVGDTGLEIGSHLHFEIWKDGEALDPLCFIDFPLE